MYLEKFFQLLQQNNKIIKFGKLICKKWKRHKKNIHIVTLEYLLSQVLSSGKRNQVNKKKRFDFATHSFLRENVPGLKAVEHKLGIVSPAVFIQNINSRHERVSCVVAPIHSNKTDFKPTST